MLIIELSSGITVLDATWHFVHSRGLSWRVRGLHGGETEFTGTLIYRVLYSS